MEAETRHLPEYRCLAPSLRPVTKPHWLRSPRCGFEQRFLNGNGPAQVGLGSFEPHRLYIKTERSVPATHANCETWTVHQVLKGHTDVLRAIVIMPDNRQVVSASDDGTIRSWDMRFLSLTIAPSSFGGFST